jgi:hypothetical protein
MISYTIDPSVFVPPEIPNDNSFKNEFLKKIKDYCRIIQKCYEFIQSEGISVYIFYGYGNDFNNEYIKKSNKYGLPIDVFKRRLDDILLYNMPKPYYGDKVGPNKYYFQNWFMIKDLKLKVSSYKPLFQNKQLNNSEVLERINLIGILNNYIYKNTFRHILILNDCIDHFILESEQVSFVLYGETYNNVNVNVRIQTISIDDIVLKKEKEYKTVFDVYSKAKLSLSEYIIFGDDVEDSINTIRDSAGPPDRIYAYLETLKDFCIYKRNSSNTIFDDEYILQSLGCICSYEVPNMNERLKNERKFDNGSKEKVLFSLHLKPITFPRNEEKRTVRIYIYWDDARRKIIVGYIGKHL